MTGRLTRIALEYAAIHNRVVRLTKGERVTVINTVSVFEFDEADKIRHLDIYVQQAP